MVRDHVALRYRELVDKKYVDELSVAEAKEMEVLGEELDKSFEEYYREINETLEVK